MALGAVQVIPKAGIAPVYAVPLASETIQATGPLMLHVKNANAAPCVVTIVDPGLTPAGSSPINPSVSVPATTGDRMIALSGGFISNGQISVTFSVQTSVSAAVFQLTS